MAESHVVASELGDGTVALFEVEPLDGFSPASVGETAGRVAGAIAPAIGAARVVLDNVSADVLRRFPVAGRRTHRRCAGAAARGRHA